MNLFFIIFLLLSPFLLAAQNRRLNNVPDAFEKRPNTDDTYEKDVLWGISKNIMEVIKNQVCKGVEMKFLSNKKIKS